MSRELPILFNAEMVRAILDDRKTVTRRLIKFLPGKNPNWTGYIKDGLMLYNGSNKPCCRKPQYEVGDSLYIRETWAHVPCIECNMGQTFHIRRKENPVYYDDGKSIEEGCFIYRANYPEPHRICWYPSIHMPKEAARIWLKVTDVRVERLQDITEEQAIREGIIRLYDDLPDAEYIAWTKNTGVFPKEKEEWGYKNYLWHGNFGKCGTGNKMSDAWEYQYSSYDSAIDSFSSLWNTTVPLKEWNIYGWDANPWTAVIEFERCEKVRNKENE